MHTLTDPESPVASLHELDDLLHSFWAHEPDCRFGERHHLLNTLRQLSIEVEQLAFRQSFHPDEPIDEVQLAGLTRRTADLAATWSKDLWVSTPWPTDLLGDRPPSESARLR
jgi:hypothetical protein